MKHGPAYPYWTLLAEIKPLHLLLFRTYKQTTTANITRLSTVLCCLLTMDSSVSGMDTFRVLGARTMAISDGPRLNVRRDGTVELLLISCYTVVWPDSGGRQQVEE